MTGWVAITCDERESLVDRLGRSYNGLAGPEYGVISSLTDLDGEHGDPLMETVWGRRKTDEPVLRDVRHPPRYYGHVMGTPLPNDTRPCEHYVYDSGCPTCGQAMVWSHCDDEWSWVCNGPAGCGYGS